MTAEYQAHSGAVNTAKTPVVNYGYSDPGTGKSRLTSMTYPDRSVLAYTYNSGLDDSISRLSSISFNTVTAESYTYLGISTVVQRSNPMVTLSYINSSNAVTGLDSFGRVTVSSGFKQGQFRGGGPGAKGTFFRHKRPQPRVKGICGEKMFRGPVGRESGPLFVRDQQDAHVSAAQSRELIDRKAWSGACHDEIQEGVKGAQHRRTPERQADRG